MANLRIIIHPDVVKGLGKVCGEDLERQLRIDDDLNDLQIDPEPSRYGWRNESSRFNLLWDEGYEIRRLRLKASLPGHRFLYHYDERHDTVYVMEVVGRSTAYERNADHIQKIRQKYDDYYAEELWEP